jgi:hypothetical protein
MAEAGEIGAEMSGDTNFQRAIVQKAESRRDGRISS